MRWQVIPAAAVAGLVAAPAQATVYMSADQARAALFPGASFVDRAVTLTKPQAQALKAASGTAGLAARQPVWLALDRSGNLAGWVILDRVYGKHEFITYALALDASGAVKGLEILEYRETYGGEIRDPRWLAQFHGKRAGARLKLDRDIRNISGATLSCRHVTDGVRRLLALHDLVLARLA